MRSFIQNLREAIPQEIFSFSEIVMVDEQIALQSGRPRPRSALKSLVSRLERNGDLVRCQKGIYTFGKTWRKGPLDLRILAMRLRRPCYITMESALSEAGLIPEAVHTLQCMTYGRGGLVETPNGNIQYHVTQALDLTPCERKETMQGIYFVAQPLQAVRDIALCRKVRWNGYTNMKEDLRLEFPTKTMEKAFEKECLGQATKLYSIGFQRKLRTRGRGCR